jgi:hypothetical protein
LSHRERGAADQEGRGQSRDTKLFEGHAVLLCGNERLARFGVQNASSQRQDACPVPGEIKPNIGILLPEWMFRKLVLECTAQ